jgi:FkbM family methyltransferase
LNFSAISREGLLGKALRVPLSLIPKATVLPILQGPLAGKRWIVGSSNHGCWLGSYEYEKQRLLANLISTGDVVFDLGANVGFYTLLAAVCVGPRGRVLAFEPVETNVGMLRRHLALNRVTTVQIIQAAVSDTTGTAVFGPGSGPTTGRLSPDGAIQVPTVTLDNLVFEQATPAPQVIKIDIEGGEARALAGARRLIETHRPKIALATHGWEVHAACSSLLEAAGYRLTSIDGRPVGETDELLAIPR